MGKSNGELVAKLRLGGLEMVPGGPGEGEKS
jgi:hypothetical protein